MNSNFLPKINYNQLNEAFSSGNSSEMYDMLVQPLHEELYRRNSFDFLDDLAPGQQLLLGFDYVMMQVGQGGFIQFIENGYISLLPAMIAQLNAIGDNEMAALLDDVLKVFVLNNELLNRPTTVQEFAKLYEELKEFEIIDERFLLLQKSTINLLLRYVMEHPGEFMEAI